MPLVLWIETGNSGQIIVKLYLSINTKTQRAEARCVFFVAAAFFRRHFRIFIEEVSLKNAKNSDTWKNHLAHTVLCGLIEAIHSLIQFDFLFSPVQPVVLQDGQS